MEDCLRYIKLTVALLIAGSAILLISCKAQTTAAPVDEESVISRQLDSMTNVTTDNGKKTRRFFSPIMESYEFAKEPFSEYRKGIEVTSYDSLGVESSNIVADYALYWTNRDLWELKGNVVVSGEERTLYSQQLFWDRKIKRFYSNVDSKVVEGEDVFIGEGFEADDDFNSWTFRKLKGRVSVNMEPTEPKAQDDSLSAAEPVSVATPVSAPVPPSAPTSAPADNEVKARVLDETLAPARRLRSEKPVALEKAAIEKQ